MRLIGFYDYTVVLTYLSLISGFLGILRAAGGHFGSAVLCLVICGVCDLFDGPVARTKKNRSQDEKNFGIQLDSLCDMVCFGAFPALFCYFSGVQTAVGIAILIVYTLCALIRLAFFNVLEINRQHTEGGCAKTYRGLPVTSSAILLPLAYLLGRALPAALPWLYYGVMALMAVLFVADFSVRKVDVSAVLRRLTGKKERV